MLSIFFALTLTSPAEALTNAPLELEDECEKRESHACSPDLCQLLFLRANFGLSLDRNDVTDQGGALMMFVANQAGKIVRDAQVVTTILAEDGRQIMARAQAYKGGYLVDAWGLASGRYRLETEIITNGWLLTDELFFARLEDEGLLTFILY